MGIIKKTDNKCWQRSGEAGTLIHYWWEFKWDSSFGKKLAGPQNVKHRVSVGPSNSILKYLISRNKTHSHKNQCTNRVALFLIVKKVKITQMAIIGRVGKQNVVYSYIIEYDSLIQRNEVLIHATN